MTDKERIDFVFTHLRGKGFIRSYRDLAQKLGMGAPNLSKAMNGNPLYLTHSFLLRIANVAKDYINPDWVCTGEGEPLVRKEPLPMLSSEYLELIKQQLTEKDNIIAEKNATIQRLIDEKNKLITIIGEKLLSSNTN